MEEQTPLIRNIKPALYGRGFDGQVYFGLFNKWINLSLNSDSAEEMAYAKVCAISLNSLYDQLVEDLCLASIRYCHYVEEYWEKSKTLFANSKDILQWIYPVGMVIVDQNVTADAIISLELNCEWEVEHGMQWLIRVDQLLFVGAYGEGSPFADFTVKEEGNYACAFER